MGLLTDVRGGQNVVTDFIVKKHNAICFLVYLGGIGLFLALAHESLNNKTYFSENALLPGLVYNEFHDENLAVRIHEELILEQKKYNKEIPYSWFLAKFNQLGLDAYTHNFTLKYPLAKNKYFYGKNVYGILRAPRSASTETLVLSTPYRGPNSVHSTTTPSIALMLSFAKFCKEQKYWAKDIIFLIVDHEQLGMQAWLEAYLGIHKKRSSPLDSGTLFGRAGAIQAAINLEFHSPKIGSIDIKIEGLNGQLPNLDLVNLADRITTIERIRHTFKLRSQYRKNDNYQKWLHSLQTLTSMVLTMASGVPTGNHGLYHRYGIEAITLEGFPPEDNQNSSTYYTLGRLLEGIFRSLNNLLEKFHQSYFFYLLPSLSHFVSIGTYIGSLVAFVAVLLIKALALWLQIRDKPEVITLINLKKSDHERRQLGEGDFKDSEDSSNELSSPNLETIGDTNNIPIDNIKNNTLLDEYHLYSPEISKIGIIFLITHSIGIMTMNSPQCLVEYFHFEINTELFLYCSFVLMTLGTFLVPFCIRLENRKSVMVLNIIALLELATSLTAIGLYNFSLGFLIGAFYVPLIIIISPASTKSFGRLLQVCVWQMFHPFFMTIYVVYIFTFVTFPEESLHDILNRSLLASQQALIFSIVDSLIYGNWFFNIITAILLPNWLCFYCMLLYKNEQIKVKND